MELNHFSLDLTAKDASGTEALGSSPKTDFMWDLFHPDLSGPLTKLVTMQLLLIDDGLIGCIKSIEEVEKILTDESQ